METNQNTKKTGSSDFLEIKDLFFLCCAKWYWFIISLGLTLGIATIYLLRTVPAYTRTASILIKDDSKGNSLSGGMDQSFADMGLFKANTNVNNEVISLQSPAIMYDVAKRLNLDMSYMTDGFWHKKVAYGATLPVNVNCLDLSENDFASFKLKLDSEGKVTLSDFVFNGEELEQENDLVANLVDTISSPIGKLLVIPTAAFSTTEKELLVNKMSLQMVAGMCAYQLTVELNNEKSSVINLSYLDVCPQRAEDILNTLIAVYNENWVKDKNQIAVSTSMFINDRLKVIERELGHVDENISSYKSAHLLPDLQAASNMYITQSSETNAKMSALNNQLYMTQYVRGYLVDNTHRNQLLPTNSGVENSQVESQIQSYNNQLLQRNALVANSSEKNPLVIDMDRALASMRKAIITSVDNEIETLNAQLKSLQQIEKKTTTRIAESPTQAKYLLSVERQQKVKESLYLYLLQKREENELSQAFTAYNTRIITPPGGTMIPTTPKRNKILFYAFALGLCIPIGIIFIMESLNTRVRGRKDLDVLTIPFIGEIPLCIPEKSKLGSKLEADSQYIMVEEGNRNIINEAFRILRANLEFMTEKGRQSNVIVMTSFNPGSGKSFLTMNTAVSLAIKGKKVLVVDGDLRHASASTFVHSPRKGISDYLGHRIDNIKEIIVQHEQHKNVHIIPVGTIPPNPTELLYDERLESLINTLRNEYDYVFLDCPPINLVADTQIIEKLADRTIFVVRAGLMERCMLPELEEIYLNKTFKNMSLVLNGTKGGGRGSYGYRYGYHYGYGSDSHYGSKD